MPPSANALGGIRVPADKPDLARLQRLLGGADLARLRARLRKRLEAGAPAVDGFNLGQLTPPAAAALAGLLGRSPGVRASMRLSYAELDAALASAGLARDLRQALEALDGPIRDSAAARARHRRDWAAACARAVDPRLLAVLADAAGQGLLKRLAASDAARAAQLIQHADTVLARLPAGGISLARLAADTLGDAHALDTGQPTGTLVRRVLATGDDAPLRPRDLWATQGVLVNELAKPVAVLNLAASDGDVVAQLVQAAAVRSAHRQLPSAPLRHGSVALRCGRLPA